MITSSPPLLPPAGDLVGRFAVLLFYGLFAQAMVTDWLQSRQHVNLVLLATATMIAWFVIFRRPATRVEPTWTGRFVAILGTLAPLGLRPIGIALIPPAVSLGGSLVGAVFALISVLYLGRNFGVIAAHRGVSSQGPYALVRHPLYTSYLLVHLFFLGANMSLWNLALFVLAEGSQMLRTIFEERVLLDSPQYRDYHARVRWRMIPGVF